MEYRIEFVDDGRFDVVVTTAGEASPAGFAEGRARLLADPRLQPGMSLLIDHTHLDVSKLTTDDVRIVSEGTAVVFEEGQLACACAVTPASVTYGLVRMSQALTPEEVTPPTTVVRTVDEAYRWLEAHRALDVG
jgi:hypothetical protein